MTKRMKKRASAIIAAIFLSTWTLTLSAQEEIEPAAPALQDWRQVLAEYPDSTEELYIRAEAIYTELYRTTGEKAYIDSVLMILSQRTPISIINRRMIFINHFSFLNLAETIQYTPGNATIL